MHLSLTISVTELELTKAILVRLVWIFLQLKSSTVYSVVLIDGLESGTNGSEFFRSVSKKPLGMSIVLLKCEREFRVQYS